LEVGAPVLGRPEVPDDQLPDHPVGIAAAAAEVLEVDLVVLDPPDRERQVDLQRADVRVHLVRARGVDAVEPPQDFVALLDVALVQLVVGLDRRPRDAVELVELRPQLPRRDLLELEGERGHGSGAYPRRTRTEAPLAVPRSGRACCARASVGKDRSKPPESTPSDERSRPMAFEVPPLPYDYSALEPHIDEQTMHIHHDKHHQAYVDNANKALEGTEWADRSVEDILADIEIIPEDKRAAVRNNVGGHANHSLFWEIMGPNGGGEPSGALADAINSTFGSFADLKSAVNDAGVKRFGSGWTWLVHDGTGLQIYSTANQDSPIMQSHVP